MTKTTDFTTFTTEYPNYFSGQDLLANDFIVQHEYLKVRQDYYNKILNVSGIIEGLEVEVIKNKKAVKIKSGSAINNYGELIILKQDLTFSHFKQITNGELYIQYFQEKKVKQPKNIANSYTRWIENPLLGIAAITPDNCVKLAKLTIAENAITIDANVREYSGLSLPNSNSKTLTFRSGGNANPNLAVLTGSLKIDGDLTVNGSGKSIIAGSLTVSGDIHAGNSVIYLTKTDHKHISIGNTEGWASIENAVNFNALMILGRGGTSKGRCVKLWDYLQVNGDMDITGNVGIGIEQSGQYKLNVHGDQYISGDLIVEGTISAQNIINVNGWSVKRVLYSSGAFVQLSASDWVENNQEGTKKFVELNRDEWSVYLKSDDLPGRTQLDLWTKEVKYQDSVLHQITSAA